MKIFSKNDTLHREAIGWTPMTDFASSPLVSTTMHSLLPKGNTALSNPRSNALHKHEGNTPTLVTCILEQHKTTQFFLLCPGIHRMDVISY